LSWANLRGHEPLVESFRNVIRRGRLAHAYLFVGSAGVGKRQFAVELAKSLLCEDPAAQAQIDACDRCPACLQVAAQAHPDYQEVGLPEDKHEFPIDVMQELIRHLAVKPARGRYRAAIVNDADDFNEESANCFLKTLEEPPPMSLLILLGTSSDRQLATIRSRCQIIRFGALPEDLVVAELVKDGLAPNADEARRLVRLAGGSLADARALADPAIRAFRRELLDNVSKSGYDSVALGERLLKFAEEAGKESALKRQRAALAMKFLIDFVRAAIMLQEGNPPTLADPQDGQAIARLAERVSPERLLAMLERCLEADYQSGRRLQLGLLLEALIDALAK
jgi:DNA polymerase-3 subunit delta'